MQRLWVPGFSVVEIAGSHLDAPKWTGPSSPVGSTVFPGTLLFMVTALVKVHSFRVL